MPESYDDLIGLPYELGAFGPESYDCFGLVLEVLKRMDFPLEWPIASEWIRRYTPGESDPNDITLREVESSEEYPKRPGDILVMKGPEAMSNRATHVAVLISSNMVIQSTRKLGVHLVPFSAVEEYTVEVITWE